MKLILITFNLNMDRHLHIMSFFSNYTNVSISLFLFFLAFLTGYSGQVFGNELPFQNGTYVTDSKLCDQQDEFHELNKDQQPILLRLENNFYFYNDSYCEIKRIKIYGTDIVFNGACGSEGEETTKRIIWVKINENEFQSGNSKYKRCISKKQIKSGRKISKNNPGNNIGVTNKRLIISLQEALNKLGYKTKEIDGKVSKNTLAALNDFQKDNKFSQTKIITKKAYEEVLNAKYRLKGIIKITPSESNTIKQSSTLLPSDIPSILKFKLGTQKLKIHEFSAPVCEEHNGIMVIKETNADATTPDDYIIADACFEEEKREFVLMNSRYNNLLLNTSDFRCVWYQRRYSGSPKRGNTSLQYCKMSELIDDVRLTDIIWTEVHIMSPFSLIGKRGILESQFMQGIVKGRRKPNLDNLDGIYQIDITGMPSLTYSRQSKVEMWEGMADGASGKMVVKNGVGTLILDNLNADWPHALYLKTDFRNPENSFLRSIYRNPRQEGYTPKEWTERRQLAQKMRFLFGKKRIGIAGIGHLEVDSYNGATEAGMFRFTIAATKIK